MYTITKQFSFEASHRLYNLPVGHQCSRNHGHSYRVEVELRRDKLDSRGFVFDYGELDPFAAFLKGNFDHKDVNEVFSLPYFMDEFVTEPMNTTAENLALIFYQWCKRNLSSLVSAVRVSETQKTWAEYRP